MTRILLLNTFTKKRGKEIKMTIYLDRDKLKEKVDREAFLQKYVVNAPGNYFNSVQPYCMLTGTPLIISVEGCYVPVDHLPDLVRNKHLRPFVIQYVVAVKHPELGLPPDVSFKWWE